MVKRVEVAREVCCPSALMVQTVYIMRGEVNSELLSQYGKRGGLTPKHFWTEDENEYLRLNYDGTGHSIQIMAQKLGMRWQQVKSHIQFLGLARRTGHARWSAEDNEKLREMWGRYTPNVIAKKLHRTTTAVIVHSKRLGLSRRSRDGWYTKKEVMEILGVDHKRVQSFIDRGQLKASWHNGREPSKFGMAMWHIEEKDLKHFIRSYPEEFNGRNVDLIKIVQILAGIEYA